MSSKKDFSECLSELMRAADLKSSKLAKAINVDASLIYKWLNNKSIPPYNSQHIDLIVTQVVKNTINSYQSKNITNFIKENQVGTLEINENNKLELLRELLIESQGYSIRKKKSIKMNSINRNLRSISNKPCGGASPYSSHTSQETFSNVQIITGYENVLNTALQLLETTSTVNSVSTEPIMITLLTETNKLLYYSEFNDLWKRSLCKITSNGWSIRYLIHINNNTTRNLKIIEDMLIPISTGNYQVYYTSGNDYTLPLEIVLVPNVGSLFCISTIDKNQVDSAFLLRDEDAINLFSGFFYQLLVSSKPLLKSCLPIKFFGFQKEYSEIEEIPGNKYSLMCELSTLSIPITLYEQYLKKSNISNQEMASKLLYHKQRIKTFESQVKHYKFQDIIYDEFLVNIIERKKYSHLDKYYITTDITITNDDVINHLSNTIHLLKSYENYEIGLISKDVVDSIAITNWTVKENSAVGIITCTPENSDCLESNEGINTLRGYTVSESNIIKAYEYYFSNLWNHLQPDKKEIILQFENYINLLSSN